MAKLLHVVINGLRADAFECAHAPCIDRLRRNGTWTRRMMTQQPYLALPSMMTMYTSLKPLEHGVTTNSAQPIISPQAVSLFTLLRYRHMNCSMFYSRDHLRLLAPSGTLQTSVFINSQGLKNVDMQLTEAAAIHLQKEKPDLCFLYLQGVDVVGHHFGFMSETYLESVENADFCVALMLEHLAMVGLLNEYVILITSDHGGSGFNHDQEKPEVFLVPMIIQGPGIAEDMEIDCKSSLLDIAPTMAEVLGIAPHPDWQGRVLREIFTDRDSDRLALNTSPYIRFLPQKAVQPVL